MTGDLHAPDAQQRRPLGLAARVRQRAARVKRTAAGRVQRVRYLALHRRAGAAGHVNVGNRVEQHARVRVPRAAGLGREQPGLVGQFHQPPEVHHAHLIAHVPNHGQVVRDEQIGQALLALQVFHDVEHLRLHRHVECRGGLVTNQKLGLRGERPRDGDALALTARELMRILFHVGSGQAHREQQLTDTRLQVAWVRNQAMLGQRFRHDVQHRPARVQAGIRILKNHLHAPP